MTASRLLLLCVLDKSNLHLTLLILCPTQSSSFCLSLSLSLSLLPSLFLALLLHKCQTRTFARVAAAPQLFILLSSATGKVERRDRAGQGWAGLARAWQRTEMRFMQPFKCPHFRGSARHGQCRPSDASIISLSKTFAFHLIPPSFEASRAGVELGSSRARALATSVAFVC